MTGPERLSVLACQIAIPPTPTPTERDAHLANTRAKVARELAAARADIVVLPELASIDYSREAFEQLETIAEPLDGSSFEIWRGIAREFNTHVVYSFPRRGESGFHITVAVVDPGGDLVGHYDKIYLAQFGASMEKEYFRRGDAAFVFEAGGFRFGVIICADIRAPELSRALTIEGGADIILHCGAYFRDQSFHSWHSFVITRALENQVYFLSLNRAGTDYGSSLFCPPWVDETRAPYAFAEHDEHFVLLVVERGEIVETRETYAFLKDRLADHRVSNVTAPATMRHKAR